MLEFLRKHQYGLMLVVAILTIIAFVFLYDKNTYGPGGGQKGDAFKVYGKGYDASTLQRLDGYFQLAQELQMYEFAFGGMAGTRFDDRLPLDFPINLIILREEGRKMGISPSADMIRKELESMPVFAGQDGKFDVDIYTRVIDQLSARSIPNADVTQLISDKITYDRVKELQAGGLRAPSSEVEDAYANQYQQITAYALKRSLIDYRKDIEVTAEEVAARYEETKDDLMSPEKRKIEFVHFKAPVFPKLEKSLESFDAEAGMSELDGVSLLAPKKSAEPEVPEPTPEPLTPEPLTEDEVPAAVEPSGAVEETPDPCGAPQDEPVVEDAVEAVTGEAASLAEGLVETLQAEIDEVEAPASTPEAPAVTPPAVTPPAVTPPAVTPPAVTPDAPVPAPTVGAPSFEEEAKRREEETAENRKFALLVKEKIDVALESGDEIDLAKLGASFIEASEGSKFSGTHGTTEFFAADELPEFLKTATGASPQRGPAQLIFSLPEGGTSQPENIRVDGRQDWLIFRVIAVEAPKALSLEEATEKITETLKEEKAEKALKDALQADADSIKAKMAGTISFKEAADELKIPYARNYKFVGRPNPQDMGTYLGYENLVKSTVAGTFSEPSIAGETGYLVYVAAKDIVDDENAENKRLTLTNQVSSRYNNQVFKAWLEKAYQDAKPVRKG